MFKVVPVYGIQMVSCPYTVLARCQ